MIGNFTNMQWHIITPFNETSWEPPELRDLKSKLANLRCSCSFCEKYREPEKQQQQQSTEKQHRDQEVQSDKEEPLKPAIVLVNNETTTENSNFPRTISPLFSKDQICSSCLLTLSLLRTGTAKVLKDEESEIKPVINTCDKATNNMVECLEKTTSYVKPLLKYPHSYSIGTISQFASEDSLHGSINRGSREVTFAFRDKYFGADDLSLPDDQTLAEKDLEEVEITSSLEEVSHRNPSTTPLTSLSVQCIDINDYMNAIRPLGVLNPEYYYTLK